MPKYQPEEMSVADYLSGMDHFTLTYNPSTMDFWISFEYPHVILGGRIGESFSVELGDLENGLSQILKFDCNRYPHVRDMDKLYTVFKVG